MGNKIHNTSTSMRKNYFYHGLVFSLLICSNSNAFSQYFYAGQHNSNNFFVDLNPDTTLIGVYVNYYDTTPPTIFPFDMNGDGVDDVYLKGYGTWHNSDGSYSTDIRTYDSSWQIAYGGKDSCGTNIAKQFMENDTINGNTVWVAGQALDLTFSWGIFMGGGCDYNGFDTPLGSYLGVRQIRTNDTIYGWIKVQTPTIRDFTIMAYAGSKNIASIDECSRFLKIYPIPTNGILTIETQIEDFDLILYNQLGVFIKSFTFHSGKIELDLSNYSSGIYFLQFVNENKVILKKIIKQ